MSAATKTTTIAIALLAVGACVPRFEDTHTTSQPVTVAPFQEIATAFTHMWSEPSHPFTGAAVIDVDGDGAFEVFVGGGEGQADALLSYRDGQFVDIIKGTGLSNAAEATYGTASSDMDGDGDVDLVVARNNGVTMYLNTNGIFEGRNIPIALDADAVPLSIAVSDVDADGHPDLYVSAFVSFPAFRSATFNDPSHAKLNVMLRNNGDLTFTDITAKSNTAGLNNTFHTVFADLDNDRDPDMILAQNTGEIEIFENDGNGVFAPIATNSGYGFWMGLAVGDIDQDGDQDIFVSNIGTSIPDFLTDGDLTEDQRHYTKWILLRNDGGMTFTDITADMNLHGYGFAWGAQFEDLNLDGEVDILVAQNYVKWPLHKWGPLDNKALLQLDAPEGRAFYQVPGLGLDNPYFGQSPIIVDIDGDGRADVIWLNMNGPLRAFLNTSNGNYLTVRIPDHPEMLGATVTLTLSDGKTVSRQVIASTGLLTDPTPDLHFGLGAASDVKNVELVMTNGQRRTLAAPAINSVVGF